MAEIYDVTVIGSGPGGYVAAIRAAQLGLKVCCIEKEMVLGGTCLNVGCIPSKALLQSTEYYTMLKTSAKEHGIAGGEGISCDFTKLMVRKGKIVSGLQEGIKTLFKKNNVARLQGSAHFVSPRMIEVSTQGGKQIVESKNFILATGSEPIALPFLPFDEKEVVSSTGALSLPKLPKKMIVIGAGVIGVELASVYSRLGTEVTLVEMLDRICPMMDEAISKMLLTILKKQGLVFHLGAEVLKGKKGNDHVSIIFNQDKQTIVLAADVVLVAVGRRPYTKGLGLADLNIGVTMKGFVQVDANFQTSLPHIYAIGDLIEGPMLAHRASEEGVAVAEIIAGHTPHINYMAIPNIIYTSPEVAAVGLTELEAQQAGLQVMIGTFSFRANPRARCSGEEEGLVKVVGESKGGKLVGMHIIGAHASELIQEGVLAIEKKMTVEELARTCHGHPTLSEAIKEAALAALGRAIHV